MSELVADCPRCRASRITFDLTAYKVVGMAYGWQQLYEAFCICRHCGLPTIFDLSDKGQQEKKYIKETGLDRIGVAVNPLINIKGFVSLKDNVGEPPPEHLPDLINAVFEEGATCLAVGCFNAAGTMFRLSVDLATKALLPEIDEEGLNAKIRRNLGLRLPWLFAQGLLPDALHELSMCIKEDGNDGAHKGTLTQTDVEDILDFTTALLERLYTEPHKLHLAKERREKRRAGD
jgi:hypothetical protein